MTVRLFVCVGGAFPSSSFWISLACGSGEGDSHDGLDSQAASLKTTEEEEEEVHLRRANGAFPHSYRNAPQDPAARTTNAVPVVLLPLSSPRIARR